MNRYTRLIAVFTMIIATIAIVAAGPIRPAKPTHLFYTPTAYLNNPYDLVVSLHEISYTVPYDLQIHLALADNVGRNCLGIRYALKDNMVIGAGVAGSLTTFRNKKHNGGHGIKDDADFRFGTYLSIGFVNSNSLSAAVTPHVQLGEHISMGADLGFLRRMNEAYSFIIEVGSSMDLTDTEFYLNLDGGVRIHPPKIPFLSFDIGVDISESPLKQFGKTAMPFLDIVFAMKTN